MKNTRFIFYLIFAILIMVTYLIGEILLILEAVPFSGPWRFFGISCLLFFSPFFLLALQEYKRDQEANSKKEKFQELEKFIDHATIISRTDNKGKITYVNKKFTEISGYKLEEVIGKDHSIVNSGIHPHEMWKEMYKTVVKDKKIWNQIVTNRSKSGGLYHVDTYIKAEFDPLTDTLIGYTSIRQDLTDLKNKEQEIRSRMDALNKSNAVIEFDTERKIIFANAIFCNLFGYSQEELKANEHRMLVRPEYAGSAEYQQFWDTLLSGKNLQAQYERVKKDGSIVWLEATYNPVFDANGKLVRILKIATDVTEKVLLNNEIKNKEQEIRSRMDALNKSNAVIEFDTERKIIFANAIFCNLFGYSQEELKANEHRMLVRPEYAGSAEYQQFWDTLLSGKNLQAQYERVKKDGSIVWLEATYNPVFDVKGKLVRILKIATDVTKQVELSNQVKVKEQDMRSRMDAINKSNAVIEFDPDRKIIFANEAFCNLFGYTMDELRGQLHSILVHKAYAESDEYTDFWKTLLSGIYLQSEYERVKKDGSILWLQATYSPVFDIKGNLIRILKIATDITRRVRQEEEILKKNTYLEHAARILRHDMHSGINTYIPRGISSLRRRISDEKIAEMKLEEPFKLIEGGLKHTQRVYQGVYEFTNLVKKEATLKLTELNLKAILTDFLSATAYRSDVLIDDLPSAMVSEQLFCTAIDNLIRNGLRYNDSLTKMVRIYMVDEEHLGILDNGRGITQEEFDFFSKNSLRRENQKESGSGLGLGICVAILKEHNFNISVEKNKFGSLIKIKIK